MVHNDILWMLNKNVLLVFSFSLSGEGDLFVWKIWVQLESLILQNISQNICDPLLILPLSEDFVKWGWGKWQWKYSQMEK